MDGHGATGIEEIIRRNVATLRAKAGLTQQGLADDMLLRGVPWTRETVAQVETTNRRLGLTEAIALAAALDVPLARLTATSADRVTVGDCEWSTAYLAAAVAGTAADVFPPEAYAAPRSDRVPGGTRRPPAPAATRPGDRDGGDPGGHDADGAPGSRRPGPTRPRAAERIERRLRVRVADADLSVRRRPGDDAPLRPPSDRTVRTHLARELEREQAHDEAGRSVRSTRLVDLTPDEAAWEATRLNILLANKGNADSDVTRWWNFTRHPELGDRTIAEAWRQGEFAAVARLVEGLPAADDPDDA